MTTHVVGDTARASRLLRPLATGLALTSAGSLSAAIVYNNTPVTSGDFAVTPGSNDFSLYVDPGFYNSGWGAPGDPDYKPEMSFPSTVQVTPLTGAAMTGAVGFGEMIDGSDTFDSNGNSVTGTQYLGFSITEGTTIYGWMSVTHNSGTGSGSGSVNEWAYDDSGMGILVGQTTAIPEPATTAAAFALLAGSAAVLKRRRQKVDAVRAA